MKNKYVCMELGNTFEDVQHIVMESEDDFETFIEFSLEKIMGDDQLVYEYHSRISETIHLIRYTSLKMEKSIKNYIMKI